MEMDRDARFFMAFTFTCDGLDIRYYEKYKHNG